jgi:regulator of sigma E protease
MEIFYKVFVFTIALSIIVFVHEYGHFWVARKNGVKIDAFSIGFGPEFFGWTDRFGTRWKFSMIPLGGYVKMFGDADASSAKSASVEDELKHLTLEGKRPLQRIAVAAAGPIANFIFTIIVFSFLFSVKGITVVEPIILQIAPKSIAEKSGFKEQDKILSLDGKNVDDFQFFKKYLKEKAGHTISIEFMRNNIKELTNVDLFTIDEKTGEKKPASVLGIVPSTSFKPVPVLEGLAYAFTLTFDMIVKTFSFLFSLITFQEKSAEIGGILTIGDQITKAAEHGIWVLFEFMAFLSLQLGAINLLPVPVLDGGHIVMNTIEMIIRRPVHQKIQEWLYRIGAGLVIALMGYGLLSDIKRYAIVEKILSFFGF